MPRLISFFVLLASVTTIIRAQDLSLKDIRKQYLNQDILIFGQEYILPGYINNWEKVKAKDDRKERFLPRPDKASLSIRGKKAVIISIEEVNPSLGKLDPFGDPIDASKIINPKVLVIARVLEDGLLIQRSDIFSSLIGESFRLVSQANTQKLEFDDYLNSIIGKSMYKVWDTELYAGDATFDDPFKPFHGIGYQTENMTPLKIVDAKFIQIKNTIFIKVELPDGSIRILYQKFDPGMVTHHSKDVVEKWLYPSTIWDLPSRFSEKEVEAIKGKKIIRGMSKLGVVCSWGLPSRINQSSEGLVQWVYRYRDTYLYFDGDVIRDWQSSN